RGAGEVQNPGRNIPFALIAGMVIIIVIYCLANLSYFYALPFREVVTANSTADTASLSVASKAAQSFLGEYGGRFASVVFVISALWAVDGSILSYCAVPYAKGRERVVFNKNWSVGAGNRLPV